MNRQARRLKRKKLPAATLTLTSLMDIFTILVLFLIVSTQNPVQFPSMKNIRLPSSTARDMIGQGSLKMVLETNRLMINDQEIVKFNADPTQNDYTGLAYQLVQERPKFKPTPSANGVLDRDVVILGNSNVPFSVLRQVMRICGEQQFGRISFGVLPEKKNG